MVQASTFDPFANLANMPGFWPFFVGVVVCAVLVVVPKVVAHYQDRAWEEEARAARARDLERHDPTSRSNRPYPRGDKS